MDSVFVYDPQLFQVEPPDSESDDSGLESVNSDSLKNRAVGSCRADGRDA